MSNTQKIKFDEKLKKRITKYGILIIAGVLFILLSVFKVLNDEFFISYGAALCIIGIVNVVKYRKILLSDDLTKKQMINENDERNISIWKEARAFTFNVTVFLLGIGVVVLYFLKMKYEASIICYVMCIQVVVYWIIYRYFQHKR